MSSTLKTESPLQPRPSVQSGGLWDGHDAENPPLLISEHLITPGRSSAPRPSPILSLVARVCLLWTPHVNRVPLDLVPPFLAIMNVKATKLIKIMKI